MHWEGRKDIKNQKFVITVTLKRKESEVYDKVMKALDEVYKDNCV